MGRLLQERQLWIAVAESCTGGGLANEITAVPGCSAYFDRGFVTYTNEAKQQLLDVPEATLDAFGAVSEQTARAMCQGVLAHSNADISLSITGIAGPDGGSVDKPVGLVWFGLGVRDGSIQTRYANFSGGRKNVRRCAIGFALQWAYECLESI